MRSFVPALLSVLFLAACGSSGVPGSRDAPVVTPPVLTPNDPPPDVAKVDVSTAARCDFLDPSHCLYPFPNDHFTVADATLDTGLRVNLQAASMPANARGTRISPVEWNRSDGFSPGSKILTLVPGVDLARSGVVPLTDIARYLDAEQPVLLLDAETGERQMIFAELDANSDNPATQALIIRPMKNLRDGRRYVVALRNLKNAAGETLRAGDAFRIYRDRFATSVPEIEARRAKMESVFATVVRVGVRRSELYLAWDFTVASTKNLTERLLHIRDQSFAALGDAPPTFAITAIRNYTPQQNALISRQVDGVLSVPNWMNQPGAPPGSRFNNVGTASPLPTQLGIAPTEFTCNIPRSVAADAINPLGTVTPGRPLTHGHGLLQSGTTIANAGDVQAMGHENGMVICAVSWIGLSQYDIPNILTILEDMSRFVTLADRLQQGVLNFMFLGRAMKHPQGFNSHPAFQIGTTPVIATEQDLWYDGNSQGGIMGALLAAVSQDITHFALGVPAMNYSILLRRSVDFDTFAEPLNLSYTNHLDRSLIYSLIQMLWDRGEPNGYANHITSDPLPNTPAKKVVMHVAFSDHQVANLATDVMARTLGVSAYCPPLAAGRSVDVTPLYGIPCVSSFPFDGSMVVYWDSGNQAPPTTNTPARDGNDPHSRPRNQVIARTQKGGFLQQGGTLVDVCGGAPCLAP